MLIDATNHGVSVDVHVCPKTVIIRTRRVDPTCNGQLREFLNGDILMKTPVVEVDREDAGVYLEYRLSLLSISGFYQNTSGPRGHLFRADSAVWTEEGWSNEVLSFQLREADRGCVIAIAGKRPLIMACPDYDPWALENSPLMGKGEPPEPEKNCWAHIMGDEATETV